MNPTAVETASIAKSATSSTLLAAKLKPKKPADQDAWSINRTTTSGIALPPVALFARFVN
ncbi:hypothetical protein BJF84_17200 [Rhodococcus sp. CUA-806]|nr:hypothetical protein BJF84_17200 [Rhodococcus sp. CUA-806]